MVAPSGQKSVSVLLGVLVATAPMALSREEAPVSFRNQVRPILSDKCFACHGPDENTRDADLRLDTQEGAFADLGGYAAIVPGDLEKSELIARIFTDDPDDLMPPAKAHKPLPPEEREILKRWIAEGAPWDSHWSYTELERPAEPEVEQTAFVRNGIDPFIVAAQEKRGLSHGPEADAVTLARRLHLDLTGLPPTPEQVESFVRNDSETAYEERVEELLASGHFGERLAIFWLDLVRYADTIGYHSDNPMEVSAYRDYVIDSFNENLPYDRFVIEQLAGDLLPEPSRKQRIASGYNRLLQTTQEGGAQPKEYIAIHAADRVRNVGEVFLGSTIGCAQCHDHKYDPFTMRDFYAMAAFFADVKEKPIGRRDPNLKLPTAEEEAEMAALRKNLNERTIPKLLAGDEKLAAEVAAGLRRWEEAILNELNSGKSDWRVIRPGTLQSSGGQELQIQPDGSVLAGGKRNPDQDTYTIRLNSKGAITGLRLEALTDERLTKKRLSRGNGNFVLTDFSVTSEGKEIEIASAKADFLQEGYPVENAIDEDSKTGWAGNGHVEGKDRTAMFLFREPIDLGEGGELVVTLKHQSNYGKHNIGRFRLSLTESVAPALLGGVDVPLEILAAIQVPAGERSGEQNRTIAAHYETISPELAPHRKNQEDWKKRIEAIDQGLRTMLVAESLPEPRMIRILDRGNWQDESGAIVDPAVPAFLATQTIEGRRANRLDLAHWIVSGENPLTSRAFVNRVWKLFYGEGLSTDLYDLGGQGQPPSHPELLDWLALEFQESGWDVKALVRLMVTSGTYRQSSVPTAASKSEDPANTWLTRQGRWRLEAELVRDSTLKVGGLLVTDIGGKSVKPYQPAGYWQHLNFPKRKWESDQGAGLYRRGIYTFWCRTFPHPAMLAFDAPSREECTAERPRSNTPQQALVLLNDPSFVEASRAFAQRIVALPADAGGRIEWAWKSATGRAPTASEKSILEELLEAQRTRYAVDAEAAAAFLSVGVTSVPDAIDSAELAAWTQVARAIFNAYESTSRF